MATNMISHWTVYAAYTMEEWRLGGPLNINFLAIFLHFPNPYIKRDQKSLVEQGKVENSVKWVTLEIIISNIRLHCKRSALSFAEHGLGYDLRIELFPD